MSEKVPKILIVDDEQDLCENLSDILGEEGYRVDCAQSGASALELLREDHYDVAILDLNLHGTECLEICRRMKEISAGKAAIIVTIHASSGNADKAIAPGARRTLLKPVSLPYLLQEGRESLDSPLVLLVDQDDALCQKLYAAFQERGVGVRLTTDIFQVATVLRDRKSSVIVVDTKLPHKKNNAVFRAVREANPQARTIVIAGIDEAHEPVQLAIQAGASEVILKPFDILALIDAVNNRLAKLIEVKS